MFSLGRAADVARHKKEDPPLEAPDSPAMTHRREIARQRWQFAIFAVMTTNPYSRAKRGRTEHWKPLRLRFEHWHHKKTAKPPTSVVKKRPSRSFTPSNLNITFRDPGRQTARLLRSADPHIIVPNQVGKWLVDQRNLAPDPYATKNQRILYAAPISVRFKDNVISEGPCSFCFACPFPIMPIAYFLSLWKVYTCAGCSRGVMAFDQPMLWRTKQYSLRTYIHIYNNRIEANYPTVRFPWGLLGCGSWNSDNVVVHYFDRGSFGFRQVPCGTRHHCCCVWEPFGEVAGRQRCPCNGPLIDSRGTMRCNQWWCDHWLCSMCCCHYMYPGLQDAAEFAAAADVALQAYFDGRELTNEEFDKELDRELAIRSLPPRHFKRGYNLGGYDLDAHSYSRVTAIIAVSLGCLTVLIQIFVAISLALYIQYTTHREWYDGYLQALRDPDNYGDMVANATRSVINLIPTGNSSTVIIGTL